MKNVTFVILAVSTAIFFIIAGSVHSQALPAERVAIIPYYNGVADVTLQPGMKDFQLWFMAAQNTGDTKKTVELYGLTIGDIPDGITEMYIPKSSPAIRKNSIFATIDRKTKQATFLFATPYILNQGKKQFTVYGSLSTSIKDLPDRIEPTVLKTYGKDKKEIELDNVSYFYEIKIQRFKTVNMYGDLQQTASTILEQGKEYQQIGIVQWDGVGADAVLKNIELNMQPLDALRAFKDFEVRDTVGKEIKTAIEKRESSLYIRFVTPLSLATRIYSGPGSEQQFNLFATTEANVPDSLLGKRITFTLKEIGALGTTSGLQYQLGGNFVIGKVEFKSPVSKPIPPTPPVVTPPVVTPPVVTPPVVTPPVIVPSLLFTISPISQEVGFTEYEIAWKAPSNIASECEAVSDTKLWEGNRGVRGKEKIQPQTDTTLSFSCLVDGKRLKEKRQIKVEPALTLLRDGKNLKEIFLKRGEALTLEWISRNVARCDLTAMSLDSAFKDKTWTAQKGIGGRETVTVEYSAKYTLTCVNPVREQGIKTATDSFSVIVPLALAAPVESSKSSAPALKDGALSTPSASVKPSAPAAGGGGPAPAPGGGPVSAPAPRAPQVPSSGPVPAAVTRSGGDIEPAAVRPGSGATSFGIPAQKTTTSENSALPQPVSVPPLAIPDLSLIVPQVKALTVPQQAQETLEKAQAIGFDLTTLVRGKEVQPSVTQQMVAANFFNATTKLSLEEKISVIEKAKSFNDGKLPETKKEAAKMLKLMTNQPLTDSEIGKSALKQIKTYETKFCPKNTCKGFKNFSAYLRGVEPPKTSDSVQREDLGITRFQKEYKRLPDLTNPLEENVVHALGWSDLTKKAKQKKAKKK